MDAGTLAHALDRLAGTGRVLYVAAHPDDENTRLLAYLANGRHVTAAYLSMTRGGGGQNLIGREQGELLDVIRTEELLAARAPRRRAAALHAHARLRLLEDAPTRRSRSGATSEALADVVWVIRTFQPDVIITRFDEQPPNHGHHTASAILAREAFARGGRPDALPRAARATASSRGRRRASLRNVPTWREGPPPAGRARARRRRLRSAPRARLRRARGALAQPAQEPGLRRRRASAARSSSASSPLAGTRAAEGHPRRRRPRLGAASATRGAPLVARARRGARARSTATGPERALPALARGAPRARRAPRRAARARCAARARPRHRRRGRAVRARDRRAARRRAGRRPSPVDVEIVLRRPARSRRSRASCFPGVAAGRVDAALALEREDASSTRDVRDARRRRGLDAVLARGAVAAGPAGRRATRGSSASRRARRRSRSRSSSALEDRVVRLDGAGACTRGPIRCRASGRAPFLVVPPATVTPAREAVLFPNGKPAPVVLRVRAGARRAARATSRCRCPRAGAPSPRRAPVALAQRRRRDHGALRRDAAAAARRADRRPPGDRGRTARRWSLPRGRHRLSAHPDAGRPAAGDAAPRAARARAAARAGSATSQGSGDTVADDLAHVGLARRGRSTTRRCAAATSARYAAIVVGIRAYNTRAALRARARRA